MHAVWVEGVLPHFLQGSRLLNMAPTCSATGQGGADRQNGKENVSRAIKPVCL